MQIWQVLLLLAAGFTGGLANAMAGGAGLFTFPAFMAVGLPPITASATNSFGLLAANSAGAIVDRDKFPPRTASFWLGITMAVAGGLAGALLLLVTSPSVFAILVPALIGTATIIFTFSAPIRAFLTESLKGGQPAILRQALVFIAAIYNGFFGAGVGVVFIGVLMATGMDDLRAANAYKNALVTISNVACVALFALSGTISWLAGFVLMLGAAAGGYTGGRLIQILPAKVVRTIITATGAAMTLIYIYKYWL